MLRVLALALLLTPLAAQSPATERPTVPPQGGGTPRIACDGAIWDFGLQPQHAVLKKVFQMRNRGDGLLRIQTVNASCGCTAAVLGKKVVPPGETCDIEVTFETRTFNGAVSKVLQVVSNDPRTPRFRLVCKGRVTPPFWVEPKQLLLSEVSKLEGSEWHDFKIVFARNSKGKLEELRPSSELVEIEAAPGAEGAESTPRADGGREYPYRLRVKKGHAVGLLRETVVVRTDVPRAPLTTVAVRGSVLGEVVISPKTFNLGQVKAGSKVERTVTVKKMGDTPMKVLEVTASPRQIFQARVEEVEPGRSFKVIVSLADDVKPRYYRGSLTIRTDCKGEEIQKAWFYALVR